MKLSCFYPNIINDFEVKFVTTDISKIKKNSIFINIQNNDVSSIPKEYLTNVLIVNQTPILDSSYICLKTENILKELTHIYNIFYNLEECSYKLIGILNDDFLNYNKVLIDLFNKQKKMKITFIEENDNVDQLYKFLNNCKKKEYHYVFWIFHSSMLNDVLNILKFDYIILPKSSYNTSFKALSNIKDYVKSNGVFLANYDDFKDLIHFDNCISFGYNSEGLYNLSNISIHNKIVTGTLFKKDLELSEVLLCLNNFDYIYFITSLFALFDNEFQTIEFVHIFFSKYIL